MNYRNRTDLFAALCMPVEGEGTNPGESAPPAPVAEKITKLVKKVKAKAKKLVKKATKAKGGKKTAKATKGGAKATGPAALRDYAPGYHKDTEKKTASGNTSIDNDDEVARKFRGKDLDAVYGLTAKALGVTEKELRDRYKKLNVGMQRMNLGNRFRAVLNAK